MPTPSTIKLQLVWVKPDHPSKLGDEAVRLSGDFANMTPKEVQDIAVPIREGFAQNFREQGAAGKAWAPLARSTQDDRIALGIKGDDPILDRTGGSHNTGGSYKASWIDAAHQMSFLDFLAGPRPVFGNAPTNYGMFLGEVTDEATIMVGSEDPRVDVLSGGLQPTDVNMFDQVVASEGGKVPARPVHIIREEWPRKAARLISIILMDRSENIK